MAALELAMVSRAGGEGSGNGNGFGGMGEAAQGSGNRRPMNAYAGPRLNQGNGKSSSIARTAFLKKSADRKGWLYINTWYMIDHGEKLLGERTFSIVHPPEISVDFDAVYTDGQVGTRGDGNGFSSDKGHRGRSVFGWSAAMEVYAK